MGLGNTKRGKPNDNTCSHAGVIRKLATMIFILVKFPPAMAVNTIFLCLNQAKCF